MSDEQENKWREEFESTFANKDVLIMDNGGNYYHHEVQDNFNTYLEARKKAQEEIEQLHSFCLHYQLYIIDILHSCGVMKSFHQLRKGAHAYAVARGENPTWTYQDVENADYFKDLKSHVEFLNEQIKLRDDLIKKGINYMSEAVKIFTPHVTNSFALDWIEKAKKIVGDK